MNPVRIDGPAGALAVDDGGRGEPVVFVHSLAGTTEHWAAQLEYLRPIWRAIALDLRGHGQSEAPRDGDYALAAVAGDVAAVADALGLERFALVGHSMGGGVALTYAGAHPQRVTRLLLVDPIGDGGQVPAEEIEPFLRQLETEAYEEAIQGHWSSIAGPDEAVRERLLRDLRQTPRDTVVQGLKAVMRFDPHPALARFRGPTLAVVTPSNDYPYSLHRLGAGLPHRVVTGTGHWLQLDRPAEFNRLLDQFLRGEA